MAIVPAYSFEGSVLSLSGEPVQVYFFEDDPKEPWFQAKPIHSLLGATKIGHTLARVHKDDKASLKELFETRGVPSRGGSPDDPPPTLDTLGYHGGKAIYVNESGLYAVILGSKKDEAQAFQRWVTKEVLPVLRRAGRYELQGREGAEPGLIVPMSRESVLAIADAIKAPILQAVRAELQQTHPWDFHKHARRNNPLVDVGVILEGDALAKLDEDERVIRITDFLKEQVAPESWRRHGNKFKNIFAIELKKQKIQSCEDYEQPLYIARVQGAYRIVYTEADDELMANVFQKCKRRFQAIATRDEALLKGGRKKRRIEDYFLAGDQDVDKDKEREIEDMLAECPNTRAASASSSSVAASSAASSDSIALHRDAVAEAPAGIRLRAKRGDANIHITHP